MGLVLQMTHTKYYDERQYSTLPPPPPFPFFCPNFSLAPFPCNFVLMLILRSDKKDLIRQYCRQHQMFDPAGCKSIVRVCMYYHWFTLHLHGHVKGLSAVAWRTKFAIIWAKHRIDNPASGPRVRVTVECQNEQHRSSNVSTRTQCSVGQCSPGASIADVYITGCLWVANDTMQCTVYSPKP